jgi:hypothetical protein
MTDQNKLEGEDALEAGRFGTPTAIENEAFTVQGQGPETAQREREVRESMRADSLTASRDPDYGKGSSSSSSS